MKRVQVYLLTGILTLVSGISGVYLRANGKVITTAEQPVLAGREAVVYRTPTCGCCTGYVEFLRKHGVQVEAVAMPHAELSAFKAKKGIPAEGQSCHTTILDGYVVEGHVPLEALETLLTERPDVDGIVLPGMPVGTPGMPGPKTAPYEVQSVDDGELSPFVTL